MPALTIMLMALQVQRMRETMDTHADRLDEALLSNAFAYIKKASDDRFDTMVSLIQKVLQLYAARQLTGQESEVRNANARACCFSLADMVLWHVSSSCRLLRAFQLDGPACLPPPLRCLVYGSLLQGVEGVLNKVVYAEEEDWAGVIKGAAQQVMCPAIAASCPACS